MSLKLNYSGLDFEAGCDEAGRGCLAGPVFAAAVILQHDFSLNGLDDSKKLGKKQRDDLRELIERHALAWAVAAVDNVEIDEINILQASITAMHRAIDQLQLHPEYILVDGIHFRPYHKTPHICIPKGDSHWQSIAAASILAKTHRDEFMLRLHELYPHYAWNRNMGYPTPEHKLAIVRHGFSPYHRKSFTPNLQLKLEV